jgi:hypothetical protein
MQLAELQDTLVEARMVWRRSGSKIKRGVRCTSGKRKGRVVGKSSQCSSPVNFKKRITLSRTKAKLGRRMALKAKRTKRVNPVSRRVQMMNK